MRKMVRRDGLLRMFQAEQYIHLRLLQQGRPTRKGNSSSDVILQSVTLGVPIYVAGPCNSLS
jgi:hypothetical protein